MGFDLTSESGMEFRLRGGTFWAFYLSLAKAYGWVPLGTLAPSGLDARDWTGRYDSNDGQRVSLEDAAALGAALKRALDDQEHRPQTERAVARMLGEELMEAFRSQTGEALPIEEVDSGIESDEQTLCGLIEFCGAGSFRID